MIENKSKIFIEKVGNVHGDLYNYSLVEYINNRIKVIIICPVHGEFKQTPMRHLAGGGCKACGIDRRSKARTKPVEVFIEEAIKTHGDKYNYEKVVYSGVKNKIIITCNKHKIDFKQTPECHIRFGGCKVCTKEKREDNLESFIIKANKIHGNKYTYINTIYKGSSELLIINCETHGNFKQTATSHLQGKGCAKCGEMRRGYSRSKFLEASKNGLGRLYVLRCFNGEEEFYKVGITTKTVEKRFKNRLPYLFEIIEVHEKEAGLIFDLEKDIFKNNKNLKYKPKMEFCGQNECFSIKPLINI